LINYFHNELYYLAIFRMLFNEFIDKMLCLMAYPIPRLRNQQEKLSIQFEIQNDYLYKIVMYFIQIQQEYKHNWVLYQNNHNQIQKTEKKKFKNINNFNEFQQFYEYMIKNKIFNYDEAEWIEDAIHEILVE
jgi:uncharacterized membrane protein